MRSPEGEGCGCPPPPAAMGTYPQSIEAVEHLAQQGEFDAFHPDQYGGVFTFGGCALYAAALVRANPTWTIVAAGEPACVEYDEAEPDLRPCDDYGNEVCGCMVGHFYAASTDGWLHDVHGRHDPTRVMEDRALHPVGDTSLRCVIESWHYNADEWDQDAAALALRLTSVGTPTGRSPAAT